MGLAMIFKLGVMPYDMVERSMSLFGEEVVPRIRQVLTRAVTVDRTARNHGLRRGLAPQTGHFRHCGLVRGAAGQPQ
jgi:hypothetical protein